MMELFSNISYYEPNRFKGEYEIYQISFSLNHCKNRINYYNLVNHCNKKVKVKCSDEHSMITDVIIGTLLTKFTQVPSDHHISQKHKFIRLKRACL